MSMRNGARLESFVKTQMTKGRVKCRYEPPYTLQHNCNIMQSIPVIQYSYFWTLFAWRLLLGVKACEYFNHSRILFLVSKYVGSLKSSGILHLFSILSSLVVNLQFKVAFDVGTCVGAWFSKFVSAVMASFVPNVFESPSQFRIALTSGVCSFNIPSVMAFTLRYPKCVFCTLLNPLLSICLFPPFGLSLNMTNSHIAGSGTAFNLPRLAVLFSSTFSVSGRTNRTLSFCLEPVAVTAVSAGFLSPLLRKRVRKFLELERLGSFAKPSARVPISKAKISYAIHTL